MSFFVVGDTHGDFSHVEEFCRQENTTKEDILCILGDAQLNYHLNDRDENLKREVEKLPITLFCVHGNHEQRPYMIGTYEEMEWHGGTVYAEKNHPAILFAKDGELYDFNGKKAVAIGGAYSVDKFYRVPRYIPWFDTEQPSPEIRQYVEQQLERAGWSVDLVFSHTCPLKYEPKEVFLPQIDQSTVDRSTEEWLDEIEENLSYGKWYCGHFHTEKEVENVTFLFRKIRKIID